MMPASRHVRVPDREYCLDFYCRQAAAIERIRAYAGKNAAPDGNTLLMPPFAPMLINPHRYTSLRYDPVGDFAPVAIQKADSAKRGPVIRASGLMIEDSAGIVVRAGVSTARCFRAVNWRKSFHCEYWAENARALAGWRDLQVRAHRRVARDHFEICRQRADQRLGKRIQAVAAVSTSVAIPSRSWRNIDG